MEPSISNVRFVSPRCLCSTCPMCVRACVRARKTSECNTQAQREGGQGGERGHDTQTHIETRYTQQQTYTTTVWGVMRPLRKITCVVTAALGLIEGYETCES